MTPPRLCSEAGCERPAVRGDARCEAHLAEEASRDPVRKVGLLSWKMASVLALAPVALLLAFAIYLHFFR